MQPAPLSRPRIRLDIVEEHFDELDFLWEHREANVFTADWNLHHLAEHEERAEAHLDGLRVAQAHGFELARARLASGETFAATAATLVLSEAGGEHATFVLAALRRCEPPVAEGIRVALRHGALAPFEPALREIAAGPALEAASAAADVLAFQQRPVNALGRFLGAAEPHVRIRGLAAAGRARSLSADDLVRALQAPEPLVRRAALAAAARCGLPELATMCRRAASRAADPDPEAVAFLGVLGDRQDLAFLQSALRQPALARAAIAALGATGRVESVPLLLEAMADADVGVAATAAYRRITGARDIEGEKPFPPPAVAEGEDEDESLPPDPAKARADWQARQAHMRPDRAWQAGIALEDARLPEAFAGVPLESRRDIVLRLASRRCPVGVEVEALALHQMRAAR